MEQLELKEIVGYLPYGLKGISKEEDLGIETIMGYSVYGTKNNVFFTTNIDEIDMVMFNPILQPLSNFESENIDDIKEYLGIGQWCVHYEDYFDAWFDDAENIDKLVLQAPYEIMEFFFLNHYDVFGLIEKGLAIAVTKDFNPYK
jgi:hypothetical protein